MAPGKWSPASLRMRNVAAYRYAREFHNAALKAGSLLVRAYLLGHALELYLKVVLLKGGLGTTGIKRRFNHNLEALLKETERHGLGDHLHVSSQVRADLRQLNTTYSSKALEYFSVLHLLVPPTLPKLQRLFRFAASLRKTLRRQLANET
jgi:HEPN domain-containing protein